MHEHSKELASRAVAYVDIDDFYGIAASPIFRSVMASAAATVPLDGNDRGHPEKEPAGVTLLNLWGGGNGTLEMAPTSLPFQARLQSTSYRNYCGLFYRLAQFHLQTLLGISSIKVGLKMVEKGSDDKLGDADFNDASNAVRFLVDLLMRLTSSPKIPLSAQGGIDAECFS